MRLVEMTDRDALEAWLRRDAELHLYELGDLDDFFFPHSKFWGLEEGGDVVAMGLLYTGVALPVVMALGREPGPVRALLAQWRGLLPARFYAHFTEGAVSALAGARTEPGGLHDRMILVDPAAPRAVDTTRATPLRPDHRAEVEAFYARAYPGNWFDPRMLETHAYFAVRDEDGSIAAVSGIHVLARRTRVAALGNVATRPDRRGRGLATIACAATCQALARDVDLIGLNVASDNAAAIALYASLGFRRAARYEEHLVEQA